MNYTRNFRDILEEEEFLVPKRKEAKDPSFRCQLFLLSLIAVFAMTRTLSAVFGVPVVAVRDPLHWGHSILLLLAGGITLWHTGNISERFSCLRDDECCWELSSRDSTRPGTPRTPGESEPSSLSPLTYFMTMVSSALIASLAQGAHACTLSADGFAGRSIFACGVFVSAWLLVVGFVLPEQLRLADVHSASTGGRMRWTCEVVVLPMAAVLGLDVVVSYLAGFPFLSRLHVHHYVWATVLGAACKFPEKSSALSQAALLGLAVQGLGVWGCDSFWPERLQ